MQDLDFMIEEMKIAKGEGISCIVDGGHPDMGRDINFLRQMSEKSGLPIVAGAGFYTQPFYPKEIAHDERGADLPGAPQAGRYRTGRRVRRDRIVGLHHEGRAEGVPRRRCAPRGDEPADLHAHRHSRESRRSSSSISSKTSESIRRRW